MQILQSVSLHLYWIYCSHG